MLVPKSKENQDELKHIYNQNKASGKVKEKQGKTPRVSEREDFT